MKLYLLYIGTYHPEKFSLWTARWKNGGRFLSTAVQSLARRTPCGVGCNLLPEGNTTSHPSVP
jgi:hypothetical protein